VRCSARSSARQPQPRRHPASQLIALYHERWEHELAYLALAAGEARPGADPDRAGFATALEAAENLLVKAENIVDDLDPVGGIGCAVLAV
jgi:hypothetical protein